MTAVAVKDLVNSDLVIYDGCTGDMLLYGEKLESIIGYAMSVMGVSVDGKSADDIYNKYCEAFEKKLEASEPYFISVKMKELKKEKIVKDMQEMLPQRVEKFDKLIDKAAEKAVQLLDTSARSLGEVVYRSDTKQFVASEFSVLKIFKSGENFEITPCHMSVHGKHTGGRFLFLSSWDETETSMTFRQKKFVLTKFDLQAIIEKAKKAATSRW